MNELVAYINSLNSTDSCGELVSDPAHWAEYGITTVPQLQAYLKEAQEREEYKAWISGDFMDDQGCEEDNLAYAPVEAAAPTAMELALMGL